MTDRERKMIETVLQTFLWALGIFVLFVVASTSHGFLCAAWDKFRGRSKGVSSPPDRLSKPVRFLNLIGWTPMVDLSALSPRPDVKIYAKAEFMNPGLSVKDRIVQHIFNKAQHQNLLQDGSQVVAATSGNTGASVAMISAVRGYPATLVTNEKCSDEKVNTLRAFGADVVVTPGGLPADHPDHYGNKARTIAEEMPGKVYDVNQYDNPWNPEAHCLTLADEIWSQTEGSVTHFVAAGSTGGTISGVGKGLKERSNGGVRVVLADPVGSIFSHYYKTGELVENAPFLVEGVGKDSIPGAMDFSIVDETLQFSDSEAFSMCHKLAKCEGLMVGGSAGGNVFAAVEVAKRVRGPAVITTILCDHGIKYLSKIYNPQWLQKNGIVIQA